MGEQGCGAGEGDCFLVLGEVGLGSSHNAVLHLVNITSQTYYKHDFFLDDIG